MKIAGIVLISVGLLILALAIVFVGVGVHAFEHPPDPGNVAGMAKLAVILLLIVGVPVLLMGILFLAIALITQYARRKADQFSLGRGDRRIH